jgi:hypothetical protein
MANTDQGETSRSREARTKRFFVDAQGQEVDKMELATGAGLGVVGTPTTVVRQMKTDDPATRMCAIMGFHTRAGNEINSVLNNKDNPGTVQEAADAVSDWNDGLDDGRWTSREGGAYARVDRDILTQAATEYTVSAGKLPEGMTEAEYTTRLRAAIEKDGVKRIRALNTVPQIAARYRELVGGQPVDVDAALAI